MPLTAQDMQQLFSTIVQFVMTMVVGTTLLDMDRR
jgi:hypothetical protein